MTFPSIAAAFVAALLTLAAAPNGYAQQDTAVASSAPAITDEELLHATALDQVFTEFGASIERSPLEEGVPLPGSMLAAWTAAARETFDADRMHAALAAALAGKFAADDYQAFATFFRSPFGERITELERAVTTMPAEQQMRARDAGIELASGSAGTARDSKIDEMLDLVSADIAIAMVRQSVRGMLIGLSMSGQQGDIEIPWEEIDAQLGAIMPDIEADVALSQRAMMYFAYQDLGDDDLEAYLEFLRTEPAKKLYAVVAFSVGQIVTERMEKFGETLARKLEQVNI